MAAKVVECKIVKHIGVIGKSGTYQKELNVVSWNGAEPTLDLRNWKYGEDGTRRALKGILLNDDEVKKLKELLSVVDAE